MDTEIKFGTKACNEGTFADPGHCFQMPSGRGKGYLVRRCLSHALSLFMFLALILGLPYLKEWAASGCLGAWQLLLDHLGI